MVNKRLSLYFSLRLDVPIPGTDAILRVEPKNFPLARHVCNSVVLLSSVRVEQCVRAGGGCSAQPVGGPRSHSPWQAVEKLAGLGLMARDACKGVQRQASEILFFSSHLSLSRARATPLGSSRKISKMFARHQILARGARACRAPLPFRSTTAFQAGFHGAFDTIQDIVTRFRSADKFPLYCSFNAATGCRILR